MTDGWRRCPPGDGRCELQGLYGWQWGDDAVFQALMGSMVGMGFGHDVAWVDEFDENGETDADAELFWTSSHHGWWFYGDLWACAASLVQNLRIPKWNNDGNKKLMAFLACRQIWWTKIPPMPLVLWCMWCEYLCPASGHSKTNCYKPVDEYLSAKESLNLPC